MLQDIKKIAPCRNHKSGECCQPAMFIRFFLLTLLALVMFLICFVAPYSCWWLHASGDLAVERVVESQSCGKFTIFGSGVSQDFVDYKLQLYSEVKPEIVAIGSSRVMQFRGAYFRKTFLNMGGVAGNLAVLRSTIDAMLKVHKPEAVILGLDFWWFMPQWEKKPFDEISPTSGSYNLGLESIKKPWIWLLEGKIDLVDLAKPLLGLIGHGFRDDRHGIMAQQTDDGFGPDGSWYYTADITGQKHPFDYKFVDTLTQVHYGIKAFYRSTTGAEGPNPEHLDALSEIVCRLRSRGIKTFIFIPPLSERVLALMRDQASGYGHLFNLRASLQERGINALDCTNPKLYGSGDCEFIDGFHGGEVAYVRIIRQLVDFSPALLDYVNMEKILSAIRDWSGFCLVPNPLLTSRPEIDFMGFGCQKNSLRHNEEQNAGQAEGVVVKGKTSGKNDGKSVRKK